MSTSSTIPTGIAVEWSAPTEPADGWGGTNNFSAQIQHDVTGELFIRVQVGETFAYLKPENAKAAALEFWRMANNFERCHWDLDLGACVSKICTQPQGRYHQGRLSPWQRARLVRKHGDERNAEILELHRQGLRQGQIVERVGWSQSTVSSVIRSARERGEVLG